MKNSQQSTAHRGSRALSSRCRPAPALYQSWCCEARQHKFWLTTHLERKTITHYRMHWGDTLAADRHVSRAGVPMRGSIVPALAQGSTCRALKPLSRRTAQRSAPLILARHRPKIRSCAPHQRIPARHTFVACATFVSAPTREVLLRSKIVSRPVPMQPPALTHLPAALMCVRPYCAGTTRHAWVFSVHTRSLAAYKTLGVFG